jgi:uncharacterized YigZ family protein
VDVTTSYLTIARTGTAEIEVKRSRFRCQLERIDDETAARAVVERIRKQHWDARHHCSAFVLGPDAAVQRSSDDGEPSGTAGIPMLEALAKRETMPGVADLSDVSAVVVRYFGGVLLGAGGLVRAYSESVSSALAMVPLVRRSRLRICSTAVPPASAGRLENDLRAAGFVMGATSYGGRDTVLRVALPDEPDSIDAAAERLRSLTAGSATLTREGTEWVDVPLP